MCFEQMRVLSRDFVVCFERRLFQVLPGNRPQPRPGDKITVRVRLDKSLDLYFRGKKLSVRETEGGGLSLSPSGSAEGDISTLG